MAATDFFMVEIWTLKGIVRFQVLFLIKLATRKVHVAGISSEIGGSWKEQMARNLTEGFDGFLKDCRYLIHDRDSLFTAGFRGILEDDNIETIRLPKRSPNLNAFAERFVRSIKEECLDQMIFFSEKSLRLVINEYMAHYHSERNHQGLNSPIIRPQFRDSREGDIVRQERLSGMLNFYYREAA